MTSPAITQAAASTRTESDVRCARILTIAQHKNCPFCGSGPDLAQKRGDFWLVGCESDDCAISPQAGSRISATDAWAKWDQRF